VTSAWRKLAEIRIIAAGLPLPKVIVPVDEIRNGKLDPEGFLYAPRALHGPICSMSPADLRNRSRLGSASSRTCATMALAGTPGTAKKGPPGA